VTSPKLTPDYDTRPRDPEQVAAALRAFERPRKTPRPVPMSEQVPEGIATDEPEPQPWTPKLPEPTVLRKPPEPDELVPAFGEITRVTMGDLPRLNWMLERLLEAFPAVGRHNWASRLASMMNVSSHFFCKTEHAVILETVANNLFQDVQFVWVSFAFHNTRGPEGGNVPDSAGEQELIHLIRAAANWGRQQRLKEVRNLTDHVDIPPSRLEAVLRRVEKREELVWKLR
jgi:hypothetical protein